MHAGVGAEAVERMCARLVWSPRLFRRGGGKDGVGAFCDGAPWFVGRNALHGFGFARNLPK